MKVGEFLNELMLLTGNAELPSFKTFLSDPKVTELEVPQDAVAAIKKGFLSFESAKNNPQIADHFKATVLGGFDKDLEKYLAENGYDETVVAALKEEKITHKKVSTLLNKVREIEQAKINATGGDKKVLSEQIEKLKGEIDVLNKNALKLKEDSEKVVASEKQKTFDYLKDYQVSSHFQNYKYANESIGQEINSEIAKVLFNKKLAGDKLKVVFDEKTGQVQLLTEANTVHYVDNKPVSFKDYTDSLLANNNLLKVTETAPADTGGSKQQQTVITHTGGTNGRSTSKFDQALTASAATFDQPPVN